MHHDSFNLDDAVAILARTPASLSALLGGVSLTWIWATDGDGTWSPYDIIDHLIQGERTNWMVRVRHILAGERQLFAPFDRTPQFTERPCKSIEELLTTFASLRRENVATLVDMQLTHADLTRTGLHPEFGTVQLRQLLATWVVHDLDHLGQIARTMARVYGDAVGPWSAYLSIVQKRE